MQRWEPNIVHTWWRGTHVYRDKPPSRYHHELHWTARICRAVWMTIALCGLVAKMAYVARF